MYAPRKELSTNGITLLIKRFIRTQTDLNEKIMTGAINARNCFGYFKVVIQIDQFIGKYYLIGYGIETHGQKNQV